MMRPNAALLHGATGMGARNWGGLPELSGFPLKTHTQKHTLSNKFLPLPTWAGQAWPVGPWRGGATWGGSGKVGGSLSGMWGGWESGVGVGEGGLQKF